MARPSFLLHELSCLGTMSKSFGKYLRTSYSYQAWIRPQILRVASAAGKEMLVAGWNTQRRSMSLVIFHLYGYLLEQPAAFDNALYVYRQPLQSPALVSTSVMDNNAAPFLVYAGKAQPSPLKSLPPLKTGMRVSSSTCLRMICPRPNLPLPQPPSTSTSCPN